MREKRKNGRLFILSLLLCVVISCLGITIWQILQNKIVVAGSDEWENMDLSTIVDPNLTASTSSFTIATARATFYDIYSDSQVYSGSAYYSSANAITDGNSAGVDTFTRFNYYLANSINGNGLAYKDMYEARTSSDYGVYPLYCGLTWPNQSAAARWGSLTADSTYGNWYAAANCNQYDNGTAKMCNEGVAINSSGTWVVQGAAAQGLVNSTLDEDGNITIGKGNYERVLPYFDENFLNQTYASSSVSLGHVVSNIAFPFRKGDGSKKVYLKNAAGETTDTGYYYFDSYLDVLQLDEAQKNVTYYYDTQKVYDTDGKSGFFPYNKSGDAASSLDYVFGTKMEINFNMTSDGKIKGVPITFEFNGDDDLWVFVDGYLVLDIGGGHIPIHGSIDFATKQAVVDKVKNISAFSSAYRTANSSDWTSNKTYNFSKTNQSDENAGKLYEALTDTNTNHKLTIFYMERGKGNSNLKIKFNLPQITTMSVGNEINTDTVNSSLKTDSFWNACNSHYFKYQLLNKGTSASDIDNTLDVAGQAVTDITRENLTAIGLTDKLRKKITSTDGAALRYRFFTFTGKNYYSMVVPKTSVPLLSESNFATYEADVGYVATIDGEDYVFKGWTTDKDYYDDWSEIKAGTYGGGMPELVTVSSIVAKESQDYYAVWAKKTITITYYDQPNVDPPLYGYDSSNIVIGTQSISSTNTSSEYILPTDDTEMVSDWESLDAHRKGYKLIGWQLEPTDTENDVTIATYTKLSTAPLCNLKLYAKWEKTQCRCLFKMKDNVAYIRDINDTDTVSSDGTWTSNIVYYEIGTKVRLPYMDDTYVTSDLSDIVTTLPIRDCYGVSEWTTVIPDGVDEDPKKYSSGEQGTRWTVPETDTTFAGTWKKVYSYITFDADSDVGGNTTSWGEKVVKYKVGNTIASKPEVNAIWSSSDTNGIPEIDCYKVTAWKADGVTITFPYTVTKNDMTWKAQWSKAYCKVTYQFDTDSNIDCGSKVSCKKYYNINTKMQTPGLEDLGTLAPEDTNGTIDGTTYYMTGADGKAYIIGGWSYDEAGTDKVSTTDIVSDTTVYAIWKEVKSSVIFHVIVSSGDSDEWDAAIATEKGWTSKDIGGGSKEWTITLKVTPGKTYSVYTDETSGSEKDTLYGADVQSEEQLEDLKDITGWAYNSWDTTDVTSDKINYTYSDHAYHLYALWTRKKNIVYYEMSNPADTSHVLVRGAISYPVSKTVLTAGEMPAIGDVVYDINTKASISLTEQAGYVLNGWVLSGSDTALDNWTISNGTTLYALWEEDSGGTATPAPTDTVVTVESLKKPSVWRKLAFSGGTSYTEVSDTWYQISDDHYTSTEGIGVGKTDSSGNFYLQYDQVASFLNCFTSKSYSKLKEYVELYFKNGSNYITDAVKSYDAMYHTTWELRDLHDFITNRNSSGSENLENMTETRIDGDGIYIYDGRVTDTAQEMVEAFKFQNENEATGSSYATNVRSIFTHSVNTGDISITKDLTDLAQNVMDAKNDNQETFTFYVYFYNIFGGTGDSLADAVETLYEGSYIKVDADGNVIKDSDGNVITYNAADGKILLKAGETAFITGIPVLTKYRIEEENLALSRRTYFMSKSGEQEVVTSGLGSESTKYIVKSEAEAQSRSVLDSSYIFAEDDVETGTSNTSGQDAAWIKGQVTEAGKTYNYIVTNDVVLDGTQVTIEKLIDRFYYDSEEEYMDDLTYQELTGAEQSFVFDVKCNEITNASEATMDTEVVSETASKIQEIIHFSPDDTDMVSKHLISTGTKGWKKCVTIYDLQPGYYELSEDTAWSWKYDLARVDLADAVKMPTAHNIFSKQNGTGTSVCRFYIPPQTSFDETLIGTTRMWNGEEYTIVMSNPVVTFENTIATDGREEIKGDTDIAVNKLQ